MQSYNSHSPRFERRVTRSSAKANLDSTTTEDDAPIHSDAELDLDVSIDSLSLGTTVSDSLLNMTLKPHAAALKSIQIPDTLLGDDSLFVRDTPSSEDTIPETQVLFRSPELDAAADASASILSPLASPYVPSGVLHTLLTDSMMPDATSVSQKHHAMVAELFQANLCIASLKGEIEQLKEQALSTIVAHTLELEELKTTYARAIPSECPRATADQSAKPVTTDKVVLFRSYGNNHILSNFFEVNLKYEGQSFWSAEHAYQWKCAVFHQNFNLANRIRHTRTPAQAKKLSRSIHRSSAWHECKTDIMMAILQQKAAQCSQFKSALTKTRGNRLIHNVESDSFWGCGIDLQGSNMLGVILEDLREELGSVTNGPPSPGAENPTQHIRNTPPPHSPPVSNTPATDDLPSRKKVTIIGNSNARGMSQELLERNVDAMGFVYPGGTLPRLTSRIRDTKSQDNEPDAVVLMAGDIEAMDGVPADNISARYQHLIEETRSVYPWSRIVLSGLPQAGNHLRQQTIKDVNHQLQILAANERLVTFISNHDAKLRDDIHMTKSAKTKFTAAIAQYVKTLF